MFVFSYRPTCVQGNRSAARYHNHVIGQVNVRNEETKGSILLKLPLQYSAFYYKLTYSASKVV